MNTGSTSKESPYVYTIFQQPWWLDAVAPGQWDEIVVKRGNEIAVRLPFVAKKKYGFTALTNPPFTQTLGPWLRPSTAKYTNQLAEQKDLLSELIAHLPQFDLFRQDFSPVMLNWLPFHWAGFSQTTYYTYRIEDLTDLDAVWAEFRENIRREIRKAQKIVTVRDDLDMDSFLTVCDWTYDRQGRQRPFSKPLVQRIDAACAQHKCRRIFFAEDAQGNIHAVLYLIWDKDVAYYLIGGGMPALRTSGAASLLIWESIKFASTVTRVYDFEGSIIEPIERFFRAFGARQVPYFRIMKMSRRMQALNAVKELWGAVYRG